MEITNTTATPSFGAKYISPATIKKKRTFLPIFDKDVANFVQFERNEADIESLYTFSNRFSNSSFAGQIANRLKINPDYQAYAFTRQQDNFEKLNPKEILGICGGHLDDDKSPYPWFFITHLEARSRSNQYVRPTQKEVSLFGRKFKVDEQYKGIGTELLKKVLGQLREQNENLFALEVRSLHSATTFYEHLGWERGLLVDSNNLTPFRLTRRHFDDFLNGDSIYKHI